MRREIFEGQNSIVLGNGNGKVFKKYHEYFKNEGYSDEDSRLIAHTFQNSADNADICSVTLCDIEQLKQDSDICLYCLGGCGLHVTNKKTKEVKFIHLSLETALWMAKLGLVRWERSSRHFLEHYWLA